MYQQKDLVEIGMRTAAFKFPTNDIPYPPSPVLPLSNHNSNTDWNITYTPHGSRCNSPSHSMQFNNGDVPPMGPLPPSAAVPLTTQWSLQESIVNGGDSSITPKQHELPMLFSFTSNSLSIDVMEQQKKNNPDVSLLNVPINDDNKTNSDYGDTPMDTPQPDSCPAPTNDPFVVFPPTENPTLQKVQNSFKTISDSSDSSSSESSSGSSSTGSSSTGSSSTGSSSDYESKSMSDQQSARTSEIDRDNDQKTLSKYGYSIIETICNTIHGCVYEAQIVQSKQASCKDVNKARNSIKLVGKQIPLTCFNFSGSEHVAIKKVDKNLLEDGQNIDGTQKSLDDSNENILKEAIILHYLSVLNKPPADNVCEFIDLIETDTDYYLVQEYGGDQTLEEFIERAHGYIQEKKLKLKHWRITVKFVFWQIAVMMYWMHNDMNTCHLDLHVDNILVKNGNFLLHKKDGSITVDSKGLTVKLSDFGFAEIFAFDQKDDNHAFECTKSGITKDHKHKSPQQFNGQTFDARKSDCYSMGVILYEMLTGMKPYDFPSDADDGYLALQTKELQNYLAKHGLNASFKKEIISLVEGLMSIDEEERLDTQQILNHEWFKHYYSRYKLRIEQKTRSQRERHQRQEKKIAVLPYYKLNAENHKHCVL